MDIQHAMAQYAWLAELLQELPAEWLAQVRIQHYQAGETIIPQCQSNYYTYIILEGVCSTRQTTERGAQLVLRKATTGDVVGFSGIYEDTPTFDAQIFARTTTLAVVLPRPLVQDCFGRCRAFSLGITQRILTRLHTLVRLFSECSSAPSYWGLITYLTYNYSFYLKSYPEGHAGPVRIVESRKNIADFLGVDVRSVQRLLVKMRSEHFIEIRGRDLYIDASQYHAMEHLRQEWLLT